MRDRSDINAKVNNFISNYGQMHPPSTSHPPRQLQHPGSTCTLLDVYSAGLDNYTFVLSRKKFEGRCFVHRGWCG